MKVLLHVNYYEGAGKFETLFKLIRSVGADGVELRAKNYYDMGKENYLAMVEELKQRNPDLELAFGYQLCCDTDEETRKKDFEDFVNFLDWAKEKCGTRLLNMFTDSLVNPDCAYFDFDKNGSALADDEMYARHGYIFKDAELRAYFNSQSWYTGYITSMEEAASYFNSIESANLNTIYEYMKDMGWRQ